METLDQRSCRHLDYAGQTVLQINSLLRSLEYGPNKDKFFSDYLTEVFELGAQLMNSGKNQSIMGDDGVVTKVIVLTDVQWFVKRMREFLRTVGYDPDAQ